MSEPTVREIMAAWLKEHGYDGLCNESCGCGVDDLMPCEEGGRDCVPAYAVRRKCGCEMCDEDDCDYRGDFNPGDECVTYTEGKAKP